MLPSNLFAVRVLFSFGCARLFCVHMCNLGAVVTRYVRTRNVLVAIGCLSAVDVGFLAGLRGRHLVAALNVNDGFARAMGFSHARKLSDDIAYNVDGGLTMASLRAAIRARRAVFAPFLAVTVLVLLLTLCSFAC